MTREDAIKILTILKANYQNLYKDISKKEAEDIIALYQVMFEDCDYKLVMIAVQELINTFQYPPTIADIKNKMYEMTHNDGDLTPMELWDRLIIALRNSYYGAEKEFQKLPEEVQSFVVSPAQLRELGQEQSSVINTVTKGQFLKQIESIKERKKKGELMLPETKRILKEIDLPIKKIEMEGSYEDDCNT